MTADLPGPAISATFLCRWIVPGCAEFGIHLFRPQLFSAVRATPKGFWQVFLSVAAHARTLKSISQVLINFFPLF
jgi:hypothetical protein